MIELTRLNGNPLAVNCDLIKYVESSPDTMLTLVTGEKVVVRESCAIVIGRVIAYRARLLREAGIVLAEAPAHAAAESASSAFTVASLARSGEDKDGSR